MQPQLGIWKWDVVVCVVCVVGCVVKFYHQGESFYPQMSQWTWTLIPYQDTMHVQTAANNEHVYDFVIFMGLQSCGPLLVDPLPLVVG